VLGVELLVEAEVGGSGAVAEAIAIEQALALGPGDRGLAALEGIQARGQLDQVAVAGERGDAAVGLRRRLGAGVTAAGFDEAVPEADVPRSSAAWRRSSSRSGAASAARSEISAIASTTARYWPE
jgi:hypothetical protein